jgi:histidyl-tRNA synthetase
MLKFFYYRKVDIMKNIIHPVKGTREFYPPEMALRNWLYAQIKAVSTSFGYAEYDGPFLEPIDLYAAKSGEELVKEQSFTFPDRGGNLITLRPELTPSLARMVAQKQHELNYPLRWWSFGPFWRYEKPQKGRTREFFQWNIDMIGTESANADAELIAIPATLFKRIGLTPDKVQIFVNDRQLMDEKLSAAGIPDDLKKATLGIIDRKDKMDHQSWKDHALESGLSTDQFEGLSRILEDKNLYLDSPSLMQVFSALDAMGLMPYVSYDAKIVRGLDYYTGPVFEARDIGKSMRAILGGGRYDNLVQDVGGDALTGVGFAMGDVVLPLILQDYDLLPELNTSPGQILVTVFDETVLTSSLQISTELRDAGFNVQIYPEAEKLGKQFKYCDKEGIHYAVVAGPDEMLADVIQVKDMVTREQVRVKRSDMVAYFHGLLED